MMDKITNVLTNLSKVSTVDKIHVTSEQLKTLESLVVGYMAIVKIGLTEDAESEMLKLADDLWDGIFIKESK